MAEWTGKEMGRNIRPSIRQAGVGCVGQKGASITTYLHIAEQRKQRHDEVNAVEEAQDFSRLSYTFLAFLNFCFQ